MNKEVDACLFKIHDITRSYTGILCQPFYLDIHLGKTSHV